MVSLTHHHLYHLMLRPSLNISNGHPQSSQNSRFAFKPNTLLSSELTWVASTQKPTLPQIPPCPPTSPSLPKPHLSLFLHFNPPRPPFGCSFRLKHCLFRKHSTLVFYSQFRIPARQSTLRSPFTPSQHVILQSRLQTCSITHTRTHTIP